MSFEAFYGKDAIKSQVIADIDLVMHAEGPNAMSKTARLLEGLVDGCADEAAIAHVLGMSRRVVQLLGMICAEFPNDRLKRWVIVRAFVDAIDVGASHAEQYRVYEEACALRAEWTD